MRGDSVIYVHFVFGMLTVLWVLPLLPGPKPAVGALWWCGASVVIFVLTNRLAKTQWQTRHLTKAIAAAWLVAALLSACMGFLQYFGAADAFSPWVSPADMGEAFANLRQRNQFASLMNIGVVALVWWVSRGRSATSSCGMAVLLALGNAVSSSRTGLAQLVLVIMMAWVWNRRGRDPHRKKERQILWATSAGYIFGVFVLPVLAGLDPHSAGVIGRLNSSDAGCSSRLTLWSNVLHLIAQKPWLGWGWGELDHAHFITVYPGPRFCEILDNAHNLPLHIAVELGIPVALLVCSAALWLILRAKPWGETNATRQMAWSVLALIGLHSLLEYPLWYGPFQMAVGLSVWLLWSTPSAPRSTRPTVNRGAVLERVSKSPTPLTRVVIASTAALWMVVLVYVGWDYWRISQIYIAPESRAEAYRDNTLVKIRGSWLFKNQVDFAELSTMPLTHDNALHAYTLAKNLLHFSPEARVAEKLIESATMLGRDDEAVFYLARYQAAFPENHARWVSANTALR